MNRKGPQTLLALIIITKCNSQIYPEESDSSSESGSEDEEEEQAQELEEVVVIDREPVMLHGAAKVTVHRSSLVGELIQLFWLN
jgi:hypothetical protein